jgi:hypothetical protein
MTLNDHDSDILSQALLSNGVTDEDIRSISNKYTALSVNVLRTTDDDPYRKKLSFLVGQALLLRGLLGDSGIDSDPHINAMILTNCSGENLI